MARIVNEVRDAVLAKIGIVEKPEKIKKTGKVGTVRKGKNKK